MTDEQTDGRRRARVLSTTSAILWRVKLYCKVFLVKRCEISQFI